jgi:hypothetical protein
MLVCVQVRACDGPNAADAIHLYFASDAGVDAGQMVRQPRCTHSRGMVLTAVVRAAGRHSTYRFSKPTCCTVSARCSSVLCSDM